MKNKIINAYIYSYASLLVIIASYKIIALLLHKNYMDAFADLFINYQGVYTQRAYRFPTIINIPNKRYIPNRFSYSIIYSCLFIYFFVLLK